MDLDSVASIIESLGMIGLMLLWLRDKNEVIQHERNNRHELSTEIMDDWRDMRHRRATRVD